MGISFWCKKKYLYIPKKRTWLAGKSLFFKLEIDLQMMDFPASHVSFSLGKNIDMDTKGDSPCLASEHLARLEVENQLLRFFPFGVCNPKQGVSMP